MRQDTFDDIISESRDRQDELLERKGRDYTQGDKDRLKNFKATAAEVGITPLQVWYVFAKKHWDAVASDIKYAGVNTSEPITSRFDDLHNYLYLGEGLVHERTREEHNEDVEGLGGC